MKNVNKSLILYRPKGGARMKFEMNLTVEEIKKLEQSLGFKLDYEFDLEWQ